MRTNTDITLPGPAVITKTFQANLNYITPVQKKREGLSYFNENITAENFPETEAREAQAEIVLLNFRRCLSGEQVLCLLAQRSLRPGTPTELVDLHRSNPVSNRAFQACFPMAALGKISPSPAGLRYVVFLGRDGVERTLSLAWFDGGWPDLWWFMALHNR